MIKPFPKWASSLSVSSQMLAGLI